MPEHDFQFPLGQRNLTPDLIKSFVKNNRLNESQTKHLYLISLFKRSQNQNEKEILYDKLLENLSQLMNLKIKQTSLLLRELKKMGLATLNIDNQWEALSKKFKVSDKKDDDNLAQFYEQTCDEAKVEVRKKNTLKRFRILFLSMDENSFTEFSEDLEKFINKSKNKYGCKDLANKSVFKLNFNAYAVTEKNKSTK